VKPRIIGLVCKTPEWWAATGVLWTEVPSQAAAANEGVFLCSLK
jgi:hypothetical protein